MKRNSSIFFLLICILTLLVIVGLVAYSFQLQMKEDSKEQNKPSPTPTSSINDPEITPEPTAIVTPDPTPSPTPEPTPEPTPTPEAPLADDGSLVLTFAGDVNLDENSKPVAKYDSVNKNIDEVISKELLDEMRSADIMMLNNEFAFSTRGSKEKDKTYTFRANPERVNILKEMGVDIVSLANNHSLDYGRDALADTFTTLDEAKIDYIGAGENLERAKAAMYYEVEGKTIAYLAASKVIPVVEWYASSSQSGVIGTYDPTMLINLIKEAKSKSDYVVVYVHWGKEKQHYPQDTEKAMARKYIDAGADAVIGCHPHVLQGMEFYKDKIIAYSLGNYWFNGSKVDTGLLKLYLQEDGPVKVQLLPAIQQNTTTSLITDPAARSKYFEFMKELSFDVEFDENGFATPKKEAPASSTEANVTAEEVNDSDE